MKKFLLVFSLLAMSSLTPLMLASASTTSAPDVDTPSSPVDANKAVITGTAEPAAQIVVTGGPYEISPVTADAEGNFSIVVALGQESENIFWVQAVSADSDPSEAVEVIIVEGAQATSNYESETGKDHTAPSAPAIQDTTIETEESTYTIEGTGEAGTTVVVNNDVSNEVVTDAGTFALEVALSGGDIEDVFNISLKDSSGNLSSGVDVKITGTGDAGTLEDDEGINPFIDITNHWAEAYILRLNSMGVVSGYGDGRFGPEDKVTRAQIVKIALLAFELPLDGTTTSFTDVPSTEWFATYVASAAGTVGIVQGYPDNTFRPHNNVTRAEALKIILEAGGVDDFDTVTPNFIDVDTVNDWYAKYTAYAKATGLVQGYVDGAFGGSQSITRAEVCKIVIELIDSLSVSE